MNGYRNSVALMLYAFFAAVAAGINFYWTVDDTPLAAAMQNHSKLSTSWNLVAAGSVLVFAVVVIAGIPAFFSMAAKAFADHRRDVLYRLAVPPCAVLVLLLWLAAGMKMGGGHWVPTPWDVIGNWNAPKDWPPLATRWTLSLVSFLLMTAGLVVSAISLRQAILRSDWSRFRRRWFTASSALLVGSVGLMVLGVLMWGWFAEQYWAPDFHAQNGGLFSSTNFASWVVSFILFLAATAMAVRGACKALTLKPE